MMSLRSLPVLLLGACFVCTGCGDTDPKPPSNVPGDGGATEDQAAPPGEPLLPWKTGNTWTYRVTDNLGMSDKVTTVGEEEAVGGTGPNKDKLAFKILTLKKDGTDRTESWQAVMGEKVIRYRERSYHASDPESLELEEHWSPYKLHIDGSLDEDTWLEEYQETKLPVGGEPSTATVRDRWFVDSMSEQVTVPAGEFDAVKLRKVGNSEKTYWYVRGVGKVKEIGGQTEELVEYSLVP